MSTKTDKFVMDFAGVEAGAKMFVPGGDELVVSLAHAAMPHKNRKRACCARQWNVEDVIFNIDISLFLLPTSCCSLLRCARIAKVHTFSLIPIAKRHNSWHNSCRNSFNPEFY